MSFLSTDYFPPFDRLTPELALREIPELIAETDRQITALEQHCEPTWNGLVAARTKCVRQLGYAWGLVSHLHGVCNSPAWREAVETLQPQIVMAFLRIGQSVPLYEALRTLRDTPATWDALPEGKRRVVEAQLRDARDAGVALKDDARVRFIEIQTRLSELGTRFSNNTLDAGKAFSLLLTTPEEVAGLPPNVLGLCAHAARAQGHEEATAEKGPWAVTLEIPIYQPFLKFSERRDLREKLYRARATRATAGELDNTPHLREILELRREMASLLGFPNYAELCLDSRMADTPAEVFSLIDQIGGPALTKARKELDSLQAFAAENGCTEPLEPWDISYWSRRQIEALFGFSSETLRPYFQFPAVLEGLFSFASNLFGITIVPADGLAPVWHPDVRLFRVLDPAGETQAYFYLDPYSRPESKNGGAWMDNFRTREVREDGTVILPLALLCCNQSPPSDGRPSLMTLGEIDTLFHEFGHALQCMLTRIDFPEASGINNIEWDAVELASQFMENWCLQPFLLRALSKHVETGETIPDDLITRRNRARPCPTRGPWKPPPKSASASPDPLTASTCSTPSRTSSPADMRPATTATCGRTSSRTTPSAHSKRPDSTTRTPSAPSGAATRAPSSPAAAPAPPPTSSTISAAAHRLPRRSSATRVCSASRRAPARSVFLLSTTCARNPFRNRTPSSARRFAPSPSIIHAPPSRCRRIIRMRWKSPCRSYTKIRWPGFSGICSRLPTSSSTSSTASEP